MARDLEEIKGEHAAISNELAELKELAKPLLRTHQRSERSLQEDLAAPGRYEVAGTLGVTPLLSVYHGTPRAVFPRAELTPREASNCVPPPGTYTPSLSLVQRSGPKVSFGGSEFSRLAYLNELKTRSPGPVYSPALGKLQGGHISTSKRDTFQHFVRNNFPSPQAYDFEMKSSAAKHRFGKGGKSDYLKEYYPGMERILKGAGGDFTATFDSAKERGSGQLKSTGHIPLLNQSVAVPGVGRYSTESIKSAKGQFSFPKSIRRIDLKHIYP